ncbi:dTDP-4-dehydrorhamnose reductase [Pseudomonadales bacterium]|nr:dTDP-4-dehydrorhamnose reductase [Pseudomonadales bacterium]
MKILILGSKGQLGCCLYDQLNNSGHQLFFSSRSDIDIGYFEITRRKIFDINPTLIINASAYTDVDKAETEERTADLINHLAVANIASICRDLNCWLIHISTDYVFDGTSSLPYKETDQTNPQGVYGQSKLMGEESVQASGCKYLIFRTAWVFSEYGNNFLKTMLRLGETHNELRIVDDQIGCPTTAHDLARVMISILPHIETEGLSSGIYNICSDSSCSWYGFAIKIFRLAEEMGYPAPKRVYPISSSEYTFKTPRPAYSVLDCAKIYKNFNIEPISWEKGILSVMNKL